MFKRWSLHLNLTAGSTNFSLRVAVETPIPSAVKSRPLSATRKLRRLLPWLKSKPPPFPPPKRPRKKKSLSNIGFLRSVRKIWLFRRRTILPATPAPIDDEYKLSRRPRPLSPSPRSPNSRKAAAAAAAAAVASLCVVVVAWILPERLQRWCGPGGLPGQWSCLSSLLEPISFKTHFGL